MARSLALPEQSAPVIERRLLACLLLVSLVHGLFYLILQPPWEHYEEPSHFEYAWLISHTARLPKYPAYDQAERRLIAGSMIAHGFYARRQTLGLPDLNATDQPIWIGVNVTGAVPLYHLLVALPLRLAAGAGVDTQLYLARLVSLGLFVLTIALAYLLMAELVPPGHVLRWAVPFSLALTPGFVDLMTAVNNDVGATFMFSLFLWATVRLVMRGFTLLRLLGVLTLAILCALTKNTVLIAVPLTLVPVFMALWLWFTAGRRSWLASRLSRRALVWGLVGLPLLALTLASVFALDSGDPALWYRITAQAAPVRVAARPAVSGLGDQALGFTYTSRQPGIGVKQVIPYDRVAALRGQTLTLGAWIWSTQPVTVKTPALVFGQSSLSMLVAVGPVPTFFAWPVSIAADASTAWVLVQPDLADNPAWPVSVYYDGIVLASGARPVNEPPHFSDPNASQGTWGGQPFMNEVRNGSAEQAWPTVRPWADQLLTRLAGAHISPVTLLGALLDWRVTSPFYLVTVVRLFRTFWGSFAWGNVELAPTWYVLLQYATLIGLAAGGWRLWRVFGGLGRPRQMALIWLGLALVAIWAQVLLRGLFTVLDPRVYIPTARYAYPAMIPSILLLVAGWSYAPWRSRRLAHLWPQAQLRLAGFSQRLGPVLFFAVLLVFDVASVLRVTAYYSR